MGFTDQFARVLPAQQRAFGIAAQFSRSPSTIYVLGGQRELGAKNTLGPEFSHVRKKEFVFPASMFVVDHDFEPPEAGEELTLLDPQGIGQTWSVFPIWDGQSYLPLDNAESQYSVFFVFGDDVSTAKYTTPDGSAFDWKVISSRQRGADQYDARNDDQLKVVRQQIYGPRSTLTANGVAELQKMASIVLDGVNWMVDIAQSELGPELVKLGLMLKSTTSRPGLGNASVQ